MNTYLKHAADISKYVRTNAVGKVRDTGHGMTEHGEASLVSCMDRLLKIAGHTSPKKSPKASCFATGEQYKKEWRKVFLTNLYDIIAWRDKGTGEKAVFPNEDAKLIKQQKKKPIGEGIVLTRGKLVHKETYASALVLKRTNNNPLGVETLTMYPYLHPEVSKATGKDLYPILIQTNAWKQANEARRKKLLTMITPDHLLLSEEDLAFSKSEPVIAN